MNIKRIGLIGGSGVVGGGTSSESGNDVWKVGIDSIFVDDTNFNVALGKNVNIGSDGKVLIGKQSGISIQTDDGLGNVIIGSNVYIEQGFDSRQCLNLDNNLNPERIPKDSSLMGTDVLRVNIEPQSNGNIKIGDTLFMPATPSGDPMHWAYVSAGAVYNATDDFIIKDAPWKDMVDTIEDKAKWGFDVVDSSQVKQMTIGGTTYNYVQTTRTSPGGTTEPRYFLVGKGSNGVWVEDETKVLHLPGHWYLNGLGDITGKEILTIYRHYNIVKELATFRVVQIAKLRTFFPLKGLWYSQYNSSPVQAFYYAITIEVVHILSDAPLYNTSYPQDRAPLIDASNGFLNARALRYVPQHRVGKTNELTYKSSTRLHVVPVVASGVSLCFNDLIQISKNSILYIINNAAPTTSITITLHADRYSQLSEDVDIVAALEAKNTALAGTGGSISLVSA